MAGLRLLALLLAQLAETSCGQTLPEPHRCILPEQRQLEYRSPGAFPAARTAEGPRPPTVSRSVPGAESHHLSLDESLQVALAHSEVVRVLTGSSATGTGRTVYDPAIANTQIDQQRAAFDPVLGLRNNYQRVERPGAEFVLPLPPVPGPPPEVRIDATDVESYNMGFDVTQRKTHGGTAQWGITASPTHVAAPNLPLNPQTPSSVDFTYTQPLLRGRGRSVNLVPIVLARVDTERSFYQLKDGVQELVRSVIEGYWNLVFARTDLWARRQQVAQLEFAVQFLNAQRLVGRADLGDTAQAEVSLANFRANLIASEAEVLNREAALLNVLGFPPQVRWYLVPTTPPQRARVEPDWEQLLAQAERNRPDIIQAKLTLEADRQRLLLAANSTLPQLDAVGQYRLNGLKGTAPDGNVVHNEKWQFTDLLLGLDLRFPVGQRASRAALRREQLTLARDRALLEQQLHQMQHDLAATLRDLDALYAQYEAFRQVREVSRINLDRQFALFREGGIPTERITAVEVLLAVTDWGNAVSSEASALTRYNARIAGLERQIGTILEDHGVFFQDELYTSMGPGRERAQGAAYPGTTAPASASPRYPVGTTPAEESFNLQSPVPDLTRPLPGDLPRDSRLPNLPAADEWKPAPLEPLPPPPGTGALPE